MVSEKPVTKSTLVKATLRQSLLLLENINKLIITTKIIKGHGKLPLPQLSEEFGFSPFPHLRVRKTFTLPCSRRESLSFGCTEPLVCHSLLGLKDPSRLKRSVGLKEPYGPATSHNTLSSYRLWPDVPETWSGWCPTWSGEAERSVLRVGAGEVTEVKREGFWLPLVWN